jgi:hypothetical protein
MSFQVSTVSLLPVLARESLAAHSLLIDVERIAPSEDGYILGRNPEGITDAGGDCWGLVLRSNDKAIVGKSDNTENCPYIFNDRTGAPVPLPILIGDDRAELETAARECLDYYDVLPKTPMADRLAKVQSDAGQSALPLVIAVFGVGARRTIDANSGAIKPRSSWHFGQWSNGNYIARIESDKARAARELKENQEKLAKLERLLNNREAMKEHMTAVITAKPESAGKSPSELESMVNDLLAVFAPK